VTSALASARSGMLNETSCLGIGCSVLEVNCAGIV
jgi:hypothetical protein